MLDAISNLGETGREYFTYNVFNVLLDAASDTATVEDELDVDRQEVLPLEAFAQLLAGIGGGRDG